MKKHDGDRSEAEHSHDEGFIVTTSHGMTALQESGNRVIDTETRNRIGAPRASKPGITRLRHSRAYGAAQPLSNPVVPNNEIDESDDLEAEKADHYAKTK